MKKWGIYIAAALAYLGYGVITGVDRDSSGTIVSAGSVDAFQLRVGDCFDDASSYDQGITNLPGVPCAEPHDNETFAVFDVAIAEYPGDAMAEVAFDSCIERFAEFVGQDYESSSLEITTLFPSSESWRQNDREVVCAVYDMNEGKLQGSVQGLAF